MHSVNEKKNDLLKHMHFGIKTRFSEILKFLRILLAPLAFWKLLVWTNFLILSRNEFKGSLNPFFNFERITYNVKQMDNVCAGP